MTANLYRGSLCLYRSVQKNVNVAMADTMAEAKALFDKRFSEITLGSLRACRCRSKCMPRHDASVSVRGTNAVSASRAMRPIEEV